MVGRARHASAVDLLGGVELAHLAERIAQREQRERVVLARGERAFGAPRALFGATELDQRDRAARERRDALRLERDRALELRSAAFGSRLVERVAQPFVGRGVLRRLAPPSFSYAATALSTSPRRMYTPPSTAFGAAAFGSAARAASAIRSASS